MRQYKQERNYLAQQKKPKKNGEGILRFIFINNVYFPSVTQAAKFIAEQEDKNVQTIRKELRQFVNGKRSSWYMYGKYLIG